MADSQLFVQNQSSTLAGAGVSIGATSMILTSLTDPDGNTLAMTDFGSKGWMTIEPNSSDREEQISFTGITQNANGTATLTGIKNVGFVAPYTETSGFLKSHPGGVKGVVSNTAGFYNNLTSKTNDETISGIYIFTTPNVPRLDTAHIYGAGEEEYFATKRYADSLAIAGAPNASTTQKGIVEIATTAEAIAGTGTGSTGALLVAPNSLVNQTPSATEIIPLTNGSGKLDDGFLNKGVASGIASLNGSTKVVEDPANATATPTASKIPIALGTGKLNTGWIDTGTGASQIVQLDGSSKLPAVDGSELTNIAEHKYGVSSRGMTTASGDEVIAHGLGRIPSIVRINAFLGMTNVHSSSYGLYDGTTNSVAYLAGVGLDGASSSNITNSIELYQITNLSKGQTATIAIDATNITITWTKVGTTDAGTLHFHWEVEG